MCGKTPCLLITAAQWPPTVPPGPVAVQPGEAKTLRRHVQRVSAMSVKGSRARPPGRRDFMHASCSCIVGWGPRRCMPAVRARGLLLSAIVPGRGLRWRRMPPLRACFVARAAAPRLRWPLAKRRAATRFDAHLGRARTMRLRQSAAARAHPRYANQSLRC